jgi:site-specific DNA recombinase
VLGERFSELLRKLTFPKDVLDWVVTPLRESHRDEKAFHDEAIGRLQAEYRRLQDCVDAMHVDKLEAG